MGRSAATGRPHRCPAAGKVLVDWSPNNGSKTTIVIYGSGSVLVVGLRVCVVDIVHDGPGGEALPVLPAGGGDGVNAVSNADSNDGRTVQHRRPPRPAARVSHPMKRRRHFHDD